ncbi:hypothetical protein, partial [Streptococcus agalactiae]|uniref:hypothetical protein n=1 Tax=Streptococcus agalactiae TaxID=1311 RepID=UPI003636221E
MSGFVRYTRKPKDNKNFILYLKLCNRTLQSLLNSQLYFIFIKCVLCEAVGSADQNHKTFKTFLFFYEKKETKKPALCHLSKGGVCSRARLKISKGQVVFFEKITQ